MSLSTQSTNKANSVKLNFNLDSYNFTISNEEDNLTLIVESLKDFPRKIFELKCSFQDLQKMDKNFENFINAEKFIKNGINKTMKSKNYSIQYDENENCIIFEMKHDIFDEDSAAKIKIPEKQQDLKTQVNSLTKVVSELRKKLLDNEKNLKSKEDEAVNSFNNTAFLTNEEKKLISKWIHPNKIIKFNLLFSTNIDGDSSSAFHYNCDGFVPTVTVVLDTNGRRFGGYSTQNWSQCSIGNNYSRAPGSFIFNLSNKQKYDLVDQSNKNAVYRYNSYGPTFGGGYDLYLCNSCKSNNSYCNKSSSSSYNTGNNNLLGSSGQTYFIVSYYEVYQVVFE